MSIDGTYSFVYSGAIGLGFGCIKITSGVVRGWDMGGGRYVGTAKENADGTISIDVGFHVRAHVPLVQGTAAKELPYERRIAGTFPPRFGDGAPVSLDTGPGVVIVMFKQVPAEGATILEDQGITLSLPPLSRA